MPGVIMENGSRHAAFTNHDRDTLQNGMNGAVHAAERAYEKGKGRPESQLEDIRRPVLNGNNVQQGEPPHPGANTVEPIPRDMMEQISKLPPEIVHITEGFQPLPGLLARLAQVTHNRLTSKIVELASMPTPSSVLNGNSTHYGNGADDNSVDNVKKKVQLLKFVEETHANWTKALVITQWSRISEDVSKVIDLKVHLDGQKIYFDEALYGLSEVTRSLVHARLPNPDLKTAVEVLSTGKASWMPDLGYLESSPLTGKELLKSLQNLNTLLAIRLNLHEYDKIPYHFRDYSIKSGRVTFKVAGEFEVDLTIADENPATQFWFIDFRFLFSPALSQLPDHMRYMIENRVNAALEKDELQGCYKFLHELVLTHKVAELRRQAIELSRGRWIETLQVEPLHRALSIQYWFDRFGKDGPRSWIIIGIDSGRPKGRLPDQKDTSRISIRWFRDSKEVKDAEITLELTDLSAELLLQQVIRRHIFHILSSTHTKLRTKPLFANRLLALSFLKSTESSEPELKVQLTSHNHISISIEPVSGRFAINPASRLVSQTEWNLNTQSKDPSANAHEFIENLRCVSMSESITSRALSVGWVPIRNPGLKQDDLKPIFPRDTMQLSWFRRPGWNQDWLVVLSSSMSGERWWLIEIASVPDAPKVKSHFQIPLPSVSTEPTHAFLSGLHLFAAAMVSYFVNARSLHSRRALYLMHDGAPKAVTSSMKLPSIIISLGTLLPTKIKVPWATDAIKIRFQGIETTVSKGTLQTATTSPADQILTKDTLEENAVVVAEGHMSSPIPPGLLVKQRIDRDIAFHPTSGAFAFKLQSKVGNDAINMLTERLERVRQLAQLVQTIKNHEKVLSCDAISLGRISFTYQNAILQRQDSGMVGDSHVYRATVDFSSSGKALDLELESGNPHIRILDDLFKILNSDLGLDAVASLLPKTLPILRAFDMIEDSWMANDKGNVTIFNRAVDWYTIRYVLVGDQQAKKVTFTVRLQHRNKKAWWCIRREHDRQPATDAVDTALKTVWDDDGQSWMGMQDAGIAKPEGAEELLTRVDIVMREVAKSGVAWNAMQLPTPEHSQTHPGQQHAVNDELQSGNETIVID